MFVKPFAHTWHASQIQHKGGIEPPSRVVQATPTCLQTPGYHAHRPNVLRTICMVNNYCSKYRVINPERILCINLRSMQRTQRPIYNPTHFMWEINK